MPGDPEYAAPCEELPQSMATPGDPVVTRRMSGGHGTFFGDTMFALIPDDVLCPRVGDEIRGAFDAAGCARWVHDGKNKPAAMPCWTVPAGAPEDPDELPPRARRAVEAALRNRKRGKAGTTERPRRRAR